ncbi:dihydropteroate synthase [Flavobacterium sp. NRK F7]|uniref:dihydropteroate synthase n=1 Tax=Flavobacterium sp. NRK F7 TaxID=2954930 RepID=UPI002090734E|nr:dihydropteroate synthase [Flavobacterium sp. NRK F7]MCO6163807.1 dihydropteroate synthase [Flavobacterium sp. NRK F7]
MTINCRGKLIDLSRPKVMGILNTTPDSFYDGGKYKNDQAILQQVEKMLKEGATFIDIGAYSSKPGAAFVSEEEEINRLLPIIDLIVNRFPEILVSVDTFRSVVAEAAVLHGASIINDIAAGFLDHNMLPTVAKLQVPYIMMHMKGTPETMQSLAFYEDIFKEMMCYFSERIAIARSYGINDVLIDPGFGFAKTLEHNYQLMQHLDYFLHLNLPILIGVSRKSMLYKLLETTPEHALNGTTVLNTIGLQKGASILRVHDVKEAVECITILEELKKIT